MNNIFTLWSLLKKQKIEIPIIQRDYAQGRIGKEFLREKFLGALINALESKKGMPLDFIYGTVEHEGTMWPLDGQQRLTTLWLFHWYIALRIGKLAEKDISTILMMFTYETRITSRDFCKHLCQISPNVFNNSGQGIVQFIKDQTWYYSTYNQDPTVQGMLRTLGGTEIKNSEDKDIKDGIEEYLKETSNSILEGYWDQLVSENCPITFVYKDMKDNDLPLSDDLYIKMNARGKQLTDFENFKADLIGFAPNPDEPSKHLLTVEEAALIDNEWNDIFWPEAVSKEIFNTDLIYFKFLRRYILNYYIVHSSAPVEIIQASDLYKNLYKGDSVYTTIKTYKDALVRDFIDSIKGFFSRWSSSSCNHSLDPLWETNEPFSFIPGFIIDERDKDGIPTSFSATAITQKQRVVFHAITAYFEENCQVDETSFGDWMCFVWNVVENSNLNTESAMIAALRLIEELRGASGNIIKFLASGKEIVSNYAKRQITEERYKARLLSGENASEWRELIRKAEGSKVLKGNIGCLLRHSTSDFVDDKDCFIKKFSKIELYFDEKGIKTEYKFDVTKALLKRITHWNSLLGSRGEQYLCDTSLSFWKERIFEQQENDSTSYFSEINDILLADDIKAIDYCSLEDTNPWIESANHIKKTLSESCLLTDDIVFQGSKWRLHWYWGRICFYKYNGRYAYLFDWVDLQQGFRRNELLRNPSITVNPNNKEEDLDDVYWNWNIRFEYNGVQFEWEWRNKIYLNDNEGKRIKKADELTYYELDMNPLHSIGSEEFLIKLNDLASAVSK